MTPLLEPDSPSRHHANGGGGKRKTTTSQYARWAVVLICIGAAWSNFSSSQSSSFWGGYDSADVFFSNVHEAASFARCKPHTSDSAWHFYADLVPVNEALAKRAKLQSRQPTKTPLLTPGDKPNQDPIPHRLLFTHRINLFDCQAVINSGDAQLLTLAENAKRTASLYAHAWQSDDSTHGGTEVVFMSDIYCRNVLDEVEPRLLKRFQQSKGAHRADLCRLAELYARGGYYFDVDVLPVNVFRPPRPGIRLVTARGMNWPQAPLFHAFLAVAPHHAVIRLALDRLVNVTLGKATNLPPGWTPSWSLKEAYEDYFNLTTSTTASSDDGYDDFDDELDFLPPSERTENVAAKNEPPLDPSVYFLDEIDTSQLSEKPDHPLHALPPRGDLRDLHKKKRFSTEDCRQAVVDHAAANNDTVYFFSKVYGVAGCGQRNPRYPWPDNYKDALAPEFKEWFV